MFPTQQRPVGQLVAVVTMQLVVRIEVHEATVTTHHAVEGVLRTTVLLAYRQDDRQ